MLSTISNVSGAESTEFNHPDRLGTRVVTNQTAGTSSEQTTLPFGTALNAESTTSLSKRFTSYERSNQTGLDYAVNRTYDSKQGRFTQVDPIGMSAVDIFNPQTLNLYTYCGNDPINHVDPDGLFWGFFKKLFKIIALIAVAVLVAVTVIAIVSLGGSALLSLVVALAFQNFVQTTLNAIYDEIKKRGFSLGSILRGFGKGVARFIRGGLVLYYGNYCSNINPNENGQMSRPPIDELDAACKAHDRDYFNARTDGNPNDNNRQRLRADIRLFGRALLALFGGGLRPTAILYTASVVVGFGIFIIWRTFRGNGSQARYSSQTVSQTGDNFPKIKTKNSDSTGKINFQLKRPILTGLTPR